MFKPSGKLSSLQLTAVAAVAFVAIAAFRSQPSSQLPTAPGQAAFGAISEVVRILEADPATDWTKVNIEALRQHLLDMDAVMMRSEAAQKNVAGGVELLVTGTGPSVGSIQRIAGNHGGMLNMMPDYSATVSSVANGVRMTVTAKDANNAKTVARIRGLGLAGLLTEGDHHAAHHIAIARGESVHMH